MESLNNSKKRRRKFLERPRFSRELPKAWADFKIGGENGLFKIESSRKKFNANTIKLGEIGYPYVVRTSLNNGIRGLLNEDKKYLNNANTISFGQDTATIFYQEQPYFTGDKIKVLTFKPRVLNASIANYLIATMRKVFSAFSWGQNSFNENVLADTKIKLPITPNGDIDFEFMEKYIRELEAERIRELEAYLEASGLTDTILSQEENAAINKITNKEIEYKEFKIVDLFDIHPTKSYGYTNSKLFEKSGNVPVVVNSSLNNGIGGYVDREALEKGNMITFSDTTTSDAIFYQPDDFIGYSHVQGLYAKKEKWNKNTLLYLLVLFRKSTKGRFDYATKFNRNLAKNIEISLPITEKGDIDFDFMEKYIRAIEKKAIKGVIDWKDKVIAKTKEVVAFSDKDNRCIGL